MSRPNKWWVLIGGLVIVGVLFTFWDYYNYHKIETQNYGHGPGDKVVTWKLDKLVQTKDYRLKYPEDLQGVTVNIKITSAVGSLVNWENKEIAGLAENEQMYGERTYENTDRINMTVIRFQRFAGDQTYMVSRYLAKKNDKLFTLEFVTSLEDWQSMEGNITVMARTLVLL